MAKISYSAWKKWLTCPKLYDFHYNERLRPMGTSSALVFGTAIDEALNHLLLTGGDPVPVFKANFQWDEFQDVEWDTRDYEEAILTEDQLQKLQGQPFSYKAWASMRVKGRMLLEKYEAEIYPDILEVHSVQQELGDRSGFLDAVVTHKKYGKILVDHKTASRPYMSDSVERSTQLALYAASEGLDKAAFIVLVKQIEKNAVRICKTCSFNGSYTRHKTCPQIVNGSRCRGKWNETFSPEAQIQVLVSGVPQINKDLITDSISQVETAVQHGVFPRNLEACCKMYGKPCPYFNKCWTNSEDGLEYKKLED